MKNGASWKKQSRRLRRHEAHLEAQMNKAVCPRCNKPGRHFVPPSGGEAGFFMCDRAS